MTNDQLLELRAYGEYTQDKSLVADCTLALALALPGVSIAFTNSARARCEVAYASAMGSPEWAARHLPPGAFQVAEMIAQFLLDEAHEVSQRFHLGNDHLEAVHDKLVEMATRIRTADWIP